MPRGDGTGPAGMGPMTGRQAGFCAGYDAPGSVRLPYGRGMGFGRGRGFRRMYYLAGMPVNQRFRYTSDVKAKDERDSLENQIKFLEEQLLQLKDRMDSLNGERE
jgi:uncharacterized protein YceH (UPF0502 family)